MTQKVCGVPHLPSPFHLTVVACSGGDAGFGMGKMFADPNLLGKLAGNPRTAKHLADPSFLMKVYIIR